MKRCNFRNDDHLALYDISYQFFGFIGFCVTMLVGLSLSVATRKYNSYIFFDPYNKELYNVVKHYLNLNLNSLLVKRQNDNPSPGAVTGEN